MATAVQIGGGNIGRGFIAQLFFEAGYDAVFVDVSADLVADMNRRGEYSIEIVGSGAAVVPIRGVSAVDGRDLDAVAAAIRDCEVASVSVGAAALKFVAPGLAAGLQARAEAKRLPLNILVCENLNDAAGTLRDLVAANLPAAEADHVLTQTGFSQAVVGRMVPLQTAADHGGDLLAIRVEAYKHLPIDADALVGEFPPIPGIEPCSNFIAQIERKLYTHNCGHATLGYFGWHSGYEMAARAMADEAIAAKVKSVMDATNEALIRRHGFDPDEQHAVAADLQERFKNEALGDTCFRLARDPVRKLAHDDRLVGAARLCEAEGVDPAPLAAVIRAALTFSDDRDSIAVEMQQRIAEEGMGAVLHAVSGIEPGERLGKLILASEW